MGLRQVVERERQRPNDCHTGPIMPFFGAEEAHRPQLFRKGCKTDSLSLTKLGNDSVEVQDKLNFMGSSEDNMSIKIAGHFIFFMVPCVKLSFFILLIFFS